MQRLLSHLRPRPQGRDVHFVKMGTKESFKSDKGLVRLLTFSRARVQWLSRTTLHSVPKAFTVENHSQKGNGILNRVGGRCLQRFAQVSLLATDAQREPAAPRGLQRNGAGRAVECRARRAAPPPPLCDRRHRRRTTRATQLCV